MANERSRVIWLRVFITTEKLVTVRIGLQYIYNIEVCYRILSCPKRGPCLKLL